MDTLGVTLAGLLETVKDSLDVCGRPVALASITPGATVAWDNCCDGQVWVRVANVTPHPAGAQPCGIMWLTVNVAVGVVRCMQGLDDDGAAPSGEMMTEDALGMTTDAHLILTAIQQWDPGKYVTAKSVTIGQGTPLGPLGYCGGWEWALSFKLQACHSGC